jgi:hypothetical protein
MRYWRLLLGSVFVLGISQLEAFAQDNLDKLSKF